MDKIKFNLGNHLMIGKIEHSILNSQYEHGKPYNYNVKNGGYTYKFTAIAVDTADYITAYMEIDSKSFHEFGIQFIEETEYRALMNQKAALSQKPESAEINFDVSDLLPF